MNKTFKIIIVTTLIFNILFSTAIAVEFSANNEYDAYVKALDYFGEIAFGNEFEKSDYRMKKAVKPINIYMQGDYTEEDMEFATQFIKDVNRKIPAMPLLSFTKKNKANVVITYTPLADMAKHITKYYEGNWGMFYYFWNGRHEITKVEIVIANDVTNQEERNHLFMEELLGALGTPNDSYTYSDSIFYQKWSSVQEPSEVDWLCLNMVYSKRLKPGLSYDKALEELKKDMPKKN